MFTACSAAQMAKEDYSHQEKRLQEVTAPSQDTVQHMDPVKP